MITNKNYTKIINQFETICKCFLLKIAEQAKDKDVYLRNCIAKTISLLKAIDVLFIIEQYNEGWILYRALIDRLVYVHYLLNNNKFIEFDEWTFVKLYEYRHNAKVDERFKRLLRNPKFKTKKGETSTYESFKARLNWQKPNPQNVLKSKDLDFIYKFGYDFASMHTHPMSWDGGKEFHKLTGLRPNPFIETEDDLLIKNSFLISSIIINETVLNFDIPIPRYFVEYLLEIKKYALGQSNNCISKYEETLNAFKSEAGY